MPLPAGQSLDPLDETVRLQEYDEAGRWRTLSVLTRRDAPQHAVCRQMPMRIIDVFGRVIQQWDNQAEVIEV